MLKRWIGLTAMMILILISSSSVTEAASELLQKGLDYYSGTGVTYDKNMAAQYFREAAELGNVEAMDWLATCYMYGDGVEENMTEAVKWFYKSCRRRVCCIHGHAGSLL